MAKRALVEHRPWLLASLICGIAYYFAWNNPVGEVWLILLKGAGVGLLAVYAWRRTRGLDGAILTLALALSAAADMVLELDFAAGGALFLASHCVAVVLYWRNRLAEPGAGLLAIAGALLIVTPAVSWLLSGRADVAAYSAALGAMAAAAWTSRFPLARIGTGAVLFILSDWLLFSRMGGLDLAPLPDILVWPTYFAAQVMIATGVVQTLRAERGG